MRAGRAGKSGRRRIAATPEPAVPARTIPSASPSFIHSDRRLARVAQPLRRFLYIEAAGGMVLVAAAVAALVWANVWPASYASVWSTEVRIEVGNYEFSEDLVHLVNELVDGFVLLRRRHGDQARAGARRAARPAHRRRSGDRRARRHARAGADLLHDQRRRTRTRGLGHPDGHRHRVRPRCRRPARQQGAGVDQGVAAHARHRRRHRRDRGDRGVLSLRHRGGVPRRRCGDRRGRRRSSASSTSPTPRSSSGSGSSCG